MKHRLILIEGLPGTEKTTTAQKVYNYLTQQGVKAKIYNEGDMHPADLAWLSYLTITEYDELINRYPQHQSLLEKNSIHEEDYVLIAYTQLGFYPNENDLMIYLAQREVYQSKLSIDKFKELHISRWKHFAHNSKKDHIYIFECAYLQNHVNEILTQYDQSVEYVIQYMTDLIKTVSELNPKLIYLSQPSVKETLTHIAKERVSTDKDLYEDWIDRVNHYVENSTYGKNHQLKGFEGTVSYMSYRKEVELKVMEQLPIDYVIIENKERNWEENLNNVFKELD